MASYTIIILLFSFLVLQQPISAVNYTVTNGAGSTPGGIRFDNEVGANYSQQMLVAATAFIWNIFEQSTAAHRKDVQNISLFIDRDCDRVAFTMDGEIHIGAKYIAAYDGDLKREILGVLYSELTHIWVWNGNPAAPEGLIDGIANYVRLRSGYFPAGQWMEPGGGSRWLLGYDVTARFLEYLEGVRSGFVAELNRRLRNGYSANYFEELVGKPVDQLWEDYKAEYGNIDNNICNSFIKIEVNGVFAL